jgi:hypothetical protein
VIFCPQLPYFLTDLRKIWYEHLHVIPSTSISLREIGAQLYFFVGVNQITYTCSCAAIHLEVSNSSVGSASCAAVRHAQDRPLATTPPEPHHAVSGSVPDYFVGLIDVVLFSPANHHSTIARYHVLVCIPVRRLIELDFQHGKPGSIPVQCM